MQEFQIQKFDYQNQELQENINENQQKQNIEKFEEKVDTQSLSNQQLEHSNAMQSQQILNTEENNNLHAMDIMIQDEEEVAPRLQIQEEVIMQQAIQNSQDINPQSQQELIIQLFTNGSKINKTVLLYFNEYYKIKLFFIIFSISIAIIFKIIGNQLAYIVGFLMFSLNFTEVGLDCDIERAIWDKSIFYCDYIIQRKWIRYFLNKMSHLKSETTTQLKKYIFVQERNFNFVIFVVLCIVFQFLFIKEAFEVYQ